MTTARGYNMSSYLPLFLAAVTLVLCLHKVDSAAINKRDVSGSYSGDKSKRPFCNAFTGCGKKRSNSVNLEAETGEELDELARHVLAEARLWEQLQRKVEMMRALAQKMEDGPMFRRKRSLNSFRHLGEANNFSSFKNDRQELNSDFEKAIDKHHQADQTNEDSNN